MRKRQSKSDVAISILAAVALIELWIIAFFTLGVMVAIGLGGVSSAIGLFVLVLFKRREAGKTLDVEVIAELTNTYHAIAGGHCELARQVAAKKIAEMNEFLSNLATGHLTIHDLSHVYKVLEQMFCHVSTVKEIRATSHGELAEWLESSSWWATNYYSINAQAIKRGVKVQRVFIMDDETLDTAATEVLRRQASENILVRTTMRRLVSPADFIHASNCLIFYSDNDEPKYAIQAIHDANGNFVTAILSTDVDHVQEMATCYQRIAQLAKTFTMDEAPLAK